NFVPILAAEIPSFDNGGLAKDGTSVTWKLKQDVVWHDGKPFTADDVIFTWEYAADSATGATTAGSYTNITRIDKLDDHTVKVVFQEPTAFWYDAFFGARCEFYHLMRLDKQTCDWHNKNAIPYT